MCYNGTDTTDEVAIENELDLTYNGRRKCINGFYCHRRVEYNISKNNYTKSPQPCYKGFSCLRGEKYIWVGKKNCLTIARKENKFLIILLKKSLYV